VTLTLADYRVLMNDALCVDLQREIVNLRRLCSDRGSTEDEIALCKPRRRSESFHSQLTVENIRIVLAESIIDDNNTASLGRPARLDKRRAALFHQNIVDPDHLKAKPVTHFSNENSSIIF